MRTVIFLTNGVINSLKTLRIVYCLLILMFVDGYSQDYGFAPRFLKFTSIDGQVDLKGMYLSRQHNSIDFIESQRGNYKSVGFKLNTSGFIWHPNFLLLDIGGEYSPESNQDDYIVTPDRSEIRTLKGLRLGATIFNSKPLTIDTRYYLNSSYSNREVLTNIESNSRSWTTSLSLRTKYLPVFVTYNNMKRDEVEIQTGRNFKNEQSKFEIFTQKSFFSRDNHTLNYSRNNYYWRDRNLFETQSLNDIIWLNNSLYFDKERRYAFRSLITNTNRRGSQTYDAFDVNENLTLKLPANLNFMSSYVFKNQRQPFQKSIQNQISARLSHKLYQSLNTSLFYNYNVSNHTSYLSSSSMAGFNLNYSKKIPTGNLNLFYRYAYNGRSNESESIDLMVTNDDYILTDGVITTLNRPNIDISTILVKDNTGSIIYQREFDYILIEKGAYIEIQRVPGGLIENNSSVYIDYVAIQEGSYRYDVIINSFSGTITLFNRFLELYYRSHFNDFINVEKSDLLILNYINQNVVGGKINFGISEMGAEYENHNSTITPYKMVRYYVNVQKQINNFVLLLNGNYRNYNIVDENINRKYSDVSGKAIYEFSPRTNLDLMFGYRIQKGPGIDLDILTARSEFRTRYRQLYLKLGASLYSRKLVKSENIYSRFYMELSRRF